MGALSVTLDPQRTEFLHDSESGHFDYTYRLSVGTDRYEFQAIPEERGRRSFYCDQTGVIRHSFTAELANAASEELR